MTTSSSELRVRRCELCGDTRCHICTETGCGLRYCQHHACEVCGYALEHRRQHPDGHTTDEEWEGRARMARAAQAGGQELTATDERALARFPYPSRLTIDGYRCPDSAGPSSPPRSAPSSPAPTQAPIRGDAGRVPTAAPGGAA